MRGGREDAHARRSAAAFGRRLSPGHRSCRHAWFAFRPIVQRPALALSTPFVLKAPIGAHTDLSRRHTGEQAVAGARFSPRQACSSHQGCAAAASERQGRRRGAVRSLCNLPAAPAARRLRRRRRRTPSAFVGRDGWLPKRRLWPFGRCGCCCSSAGCCSSGAGAMDCEVYTRACPLLGALLLLLLLRTAGTCAPNVLTNCDLNACPLSAALQWSVRAASGARGPWGAAPAPWLLSLTLLGRQGRRAASARLCPPSLRLVCRWEAPQACHARSHDACSLVVSSDLLIRPPPALRCRHALATTQATPSSAPALQLTWWAGGRTYCGWACPCLPLSPWAS